MLRVTLNSARSGVLYHFARDLDTVSLILKNGLRTSPVTEEHMRHMTSAGKRKLSRQYAENPESAFVSLTRSPSIMPRQGKDTGTDSWRYGVVFSADKLSNIAKIVPYQYSTSNHDFSLTVYATQTAPDAKGKTHNDGGITFATEISEDITWKATGKDNEPLDYFLDAFYKLMDENAPFTFKDDLAEWEISGTLTEEFSFKKLPSYIQKMMTAVGFEAEERALFPNAGTKTNIPETTKAIIGVVVPDTEYQSDDVDALKSAYPGMKIYAYRDPNGGESQAPKEAYRQPIA